MNRFTAFWLIVPVFAVVVSATAAEWGDLTGKIVIRFKEPPAAKPFRIGPDQVIPDESLLVAADGGLANVAIYLRTPSVPIHPALAATVPPHAVLAFKDSTVRPRILPLWIARQTMLLGNLDSAAYNPNLQPPGDKAINCLLRPGESEIYNPTRQQTSPVPVGCNIKSWIRAYLLPRDNPYVSVTNSEGEFNLSNLPAQSLEFQLWHEKYGYLDTSKQPQGRFTLDVKPGSNDLGTILLER